MLTYWEILTAIQSNVPVNDSYAKLWGRKSQGGYTVVTYTGTLPAVLTGTKAGYLHRYKIYGNTEQIGTPTPDDPIEPQECGERTAQLFDDFDIVGKVPSVANGNLVILADGACTDLIEIPSGLLTLSIYEAINIYVFLYDANKSYLGYVSQSIAGAKTTRQITNYENAKYARVRTDYYSTYLNEKKIMLNLGSTPLPYEPYGYKLPLISGSTPVDIYIGNDTLSTEEYVDSGTGKIYHMVGGVLTPVDPPIPFPQIPTSANSTTISWDGEGLGPSEVELKYEKKR